MSFESNSLNFIQNANKALHNSNLQKAMLKARSGFVDKRKKAIALLPEFEVLRQQAQQMKQHTLANLDRYLLEFEHNVQQQGGQVHWTQTVEQARTAIVEICHRVGAKRITKGKSMIGEEIAINQALEQLGCEVVETDLGEYIIQLAKEPPSHIIAPAVHKTRDEIADLFQEHHQAYGFTERLTEIPAMVNEARLILREKYLTADVGITGANFLIANTGSAVIVTNEGNGDLTSCLPKVHIVIASLDKVVPSLNDATVLMRLLARSATGQELSTYTTFMTGTKRSTDSTGPTEFHVVLVDNGRTDMLGNEFKDMLRCIRCGACLNHCPVYNAIGGHAYGWVYPGPMGSVLTPLMIGIDKAPDLPHACTFNARCESVCPMGIPLTRLLRLHRISTFAQHLIPRPHRWALAAWASVARRPWLYQTLTRLANWSLRYWAGQKATLTAFPFAQGWTSSRDLPVPPEKTFMAQWKARQKK